jgi:tRNA modification GTPase
VAADARPGGREGRPLSDRGSSADTIYALSSGAPPAAVAVVRISGPRADAALAELAGALPKPRRMRLATLRHNGEVLDNALILRFPGPASVTGEDVAELHLHGGRAVVTGVLAALKETLGLREALPGEFTRRAFEHGRIDLAEAEGLADLLEAETETQRRAAMRLAGGALSREVGRWQERLLGLAAEVEAALDFSDEDDVSPLAADFCERLGSLRQELANCLARPPAERLKDGIRVVIAGPPNTGKSSLLNVLAARDAAIVTALPGTTRDVIEVPAAIRGVAFLFVDTAGLREPADAVEAIGIDRARLSAEAADILLWLGAPDERPFDAVQVQPKADLGLAVCEPGLRLSALTGEGVGALIDVLVEKARALLPREGEIALNARHRAAVEDMLAGIAEAGCVDLLVAAEGLRRARAAADRITGAAGVEDMLDALFGRFCIGK